MEAVYIAAAIPIFFLAIAIEALVARRRGVRVYSLHDSIANLSSGVGQLLFGALLPFFSIGLYVLVFDRYRVATLSMSSPLVWVLAFLGVDLCYYAFHRASHRINALWAVHAVHHQSEEYNYSVALRQAWLEPALGGPFHLPLALVGVPPKMAFVAITLNTLYQFWVHTRLVRRLGALEWVLNTPSHHRVHHGRNPKYIDRNYSGMFIVWDRLFGTFQIEEEEPAYGVVKPLESFNPLWANLEVWARLVRLARSGSSLGERLSVFFGPPEWLPSRLGGRAAIPEASAGPPRFDVAASRGVNAYIVGQFVVTAALTTGFLLVQDRLGAIELAAITTWFVAGMVGSSGLVESRRHAIAVELARLAALPFLASWLARHAPSMRTGAIEAGAGIAVASAIALFAIRAATKPTAPITIPRTLR